MKVTGNSFFYGSNEIVINEETILKQEKQNRIIEIDSLLEKIDLKSIRAIREDNKTLLSEYEEEVVILRAERGLLNGT